MLPWRKKKNNMKGIKTEVKTDWKNLAHGNTREAHNSNEIWLDGNYDWDVNKNYVFSYHVKATTQISIQAQYANGNYWWAMDRNNVKGLLEADVKYFVSGSDLKKGKFDKTTIRLADDTPQVITNFMCYPSDNPMPYIDSDELKAMGGQLVKF